MDPRTEHLIALVKDGATLRDAGRVYGISGERVRQLLKQGGMDASDLPGRAKRPRVGRSGLPRELAPVIEAMWREGMLYHEIAQLFESSCEAVHALIRERVGQVGRSPELVRGQDAGCSSEERLLRGMRTAARVLADTPGGDPEERRHVQAVIDRWLAAHCAMAERGDLASSAELTGGANASSPRDRLSHAELRAELERFRADLRAGGLRESTIHAYLLGSSLFVRWLAGDYAPGSGRRERPPAREAPARVPMAVAREATRAAGRSASRARP